MYDLRTLNRGSIGPETHAPLRKPGHDIGATFHGNQFSARSVPVLFDGGHVPGHRLLHIQSCICILGYAIRDFSEPNPCTRDDGNRLEPAGTKMYF